MAPINLLAHSLKVKFGLSPYEPTDQQLDLIASFIQAIQFQGRLPTDVDWGDAVKKYCPSAGTYKYAGIDNSDLNSLLVLALQAAKKK